MNSNTQKENQEKTLITYEQFIAGAITKFKSLNNIEKYFTNKSSTCA